MTPHDKLEHDKLYYMHVTKVVKETKGPGLLGRPHCKGMAIGVARRGARRSGERTLRIPPPCSDPVSHACGPHVASFVRRSSVRGLAKARACGRAACAAGALPRRARRRCKEVGDRASGPLRATGPMPWSRQWPAPSTVPQQGVPASLGGQTRFHGGLTIS